MNKEKLEKNGLILFWVILILSVFIVIFFFVSISKEVITGDYGTNGTRVGAICFDGTRSYSTGSGTCSWHGGVRSWLYEGGTDSTISSHLLIADTWPVLISLIGILGICILLIMIVKKKLKSFAKK